VASILTVDDSRAVRVLVKKALADLALDITEAEDGEQGLAAIEANPPDLILLDVTMPVLDGAGMLERMRSRGCPIPVLLLTAESGSTVIGPMLKQGGVCDYIVKPFNAPVLRAKVLEALQRQGAVAAPPPAPANVNATNDRGFAAGAKAFVDVLVVDDMENVAKKLRTMLPERLSFNYAGDRTTALQLCRDRVYRTVIVDTEIPDVDSNELMRDLRILQPTAAFVALVLRSFKDPQALVSKVGFSAFMVKPFEEAQVETFVAAYFESQDVLQQDGNVVTPKPFKGTDAAADGFYTRLQPLLIDAAKEAAAACHDRLILDLAAFQPSPKLQKLLVRLASQCEEIGVGLRVVGGQDMAKLLKQLVETAAIPVSDNVDAAKAA
jgi:two-component system cell cycle response regulator